MTRTVGMSDSCVIVSNEELQGLLGHLELRGHSEEINTSTALKMEFKLIKIVSIPIKPAWDPERIFESCFSNPPTCGSIGFNFESDIPWRKINRSQRCQGAESPTHLRGRLDLQSAW